MLHHECLFFLHVFSTFSVLYHVLCIIGHPRRHFITFVYSVGTIVCPSLYFLHCTTVYYFFSFFTVGLAFRAHFKQFSKILPLRHPIGNYHILFTFGHLWGIILLFIYIWGTLWGSLSISTFYLQSDM